MFHVPDKFRVVTGPFASSKEADGNNGAFFVKVKHNQILKVIASDGAGWEHVSVSREDRCPSWDEMCQIKDIFWDTSDCVVQYHPPKEEYVNNHQFCLHLWRPIFTALPMPPSIFVGMKGIKVK